MLGRLRERHAKARSDIDPGTCVAEWNLGNGALQALDGLSFNAAVTESAVSRCRGSPPSCGAADRPLDR